MDEVLSSETDGVNMGSFELLLRAAVFNQASHIWGYLMQEVTNKLDDSYQPPPGFVRKGRDSIQVSCIFGEVTLTRTYYYNKRRKQGIYPADHLLGLEGCYTPALARLACLEGAEAESFETAERHLKETGGIMVSGRQIQRLTQRIGALAQTWNERPVAQEEIETNKIPILYISADGTGVPMRKEEVEGRAGKQDDGRAKTRQAYLGCVFTQTTLDEKGLPIRDHDSTTYVSSFQNCSDFGSVLRREAIRRGLGNAEKSVVLVDGAASLEKMGRDYFPNSEYIVDYFHATEHVESVLCALLGSKSHQDYTELYKTWKERLLEDEVEQLIQETRQKCPKSLSQDVEQQLHYFVNNVSRMQYGTFRKKGFFIGSGVIEAGCKAVVGRRCKQSGMFWSVSGANHILAIRCITASRRYDAFWAFRSILKKHTADHPRLRKTGS